MQLFKNPIVIEFIHAVVDLHVLLAAGTDEGPDGDARLC